MSAQLLRDRLRELLADDLGTYTLANGEKVPAIYCTEKADSRSNDRTVEGLEVITIVVPGSKYPVILKSWQSTQSEFIDIKKVCNKIGLYFGIESFENIEVGEQPELRSIVKCIINAQELFTFEEDFLYN
jgi:hypothetical protein